MSRKSYYVLSSLVCLMPILLSVFNYSSLPQSMPIHWNVSGAPDNFAAKPLVVFGIPAAMAALNIIVNAVTDCRKGCPKAMRFVLGWMIPVLTIILYASTIYYALGFAVKMEVVVPVIVGILFVAIGNYLPKVKKDSSFGIGVLRSRRSPKNVSRINRFSGFSFVACGLLTILFALLHLPYLSLAAMLLSAVCPAVYYLTLKKQPA